MEEVVLHRGPTIEYGYNPGRLLVDMRQPDKLIVVDAKHDAVGNIGDHARWEQLQNPYTITDDETGQHFSVAILNPGAEQTVLDVGAYTTNHQDWKKFDHGRGSYGYEAVELARRHPNYRWLFINNLSTYPETSNLNHQQRKEMLLTGSFVPHGEAMARALKAYGFSVHYIVGNSQGGRSGLAVAASTHFPELKAIGILEAPGNVDFPILEMSDRFMNQEGAHQQKYIEASEDQVHADLIRVAGELGGGPIKTLGRWALQGVARDWLLVYPRAMAQAGLNSDINLAMNKNPQTLLLWFAATWSAVNPINATTENQNWAQEKWDNRVLPFRLPGATHAFTNANAHYLAEGVVRQTLEAA